MAAKGFIGSNVSDDQDLENFGTSFGKIKENAAVKVLPSGKVRAKLDKAEGKKNERSLAVNLQWKPLELMFEEEVKFRGNLFDSLYFGTDVANEISRDKAVSLGVGEDWETTARGVAFVRELAAEIEDAASGEEYILTIENYEMKDRNKQPVLEDDGETPRRAHRVTRYERV